MKFTSAVLLSLLTAAPVFADAEIDVSPGLWRYEVQADLGGLVMSDAGQECVKPAQSKRSFERTAESLGQNCRILSAAPVRDGYSFSMACDGALKGNVSGEVLTTDLTASLSADGWIEQGTMRAPVKITGSAERLGDACPAP